MGKHGSYLDLPDLPFFRGRHKPAADKRSFGSAAPANTSATTSADIASNAGVSPSKKLQMPTQCITQFDKWHALLEYSEHQEEILSDMRKYEYRHLTTTLRIFAKFLFAYQSLSCCAIAKSSWTRNRRME